MFGSFLKLTGGKPELEARQFVRDYIHNQKQDALTFRVPDESGICPLFIDIDLDFDGKVKFDEEEMRSKHIVTAQNIGRVLRSFATNNTVFNVVMSKRPGYYKGKKKIREKGQYKEVEVSREGFHIWFWNVKLNRKQCMKFRQALLEDEFDFDEHYGTEVDELGWWVSKEEIYDKALFMRKNGLIIIGQKKPGAAGTAHELFYENTLNGNCEWGSTPRERFTEAERITALKRLYKFLFRKRAKKVDNPVEDTKRPQKEEAKAKRAVPVVRPEDGFDLDELLRAFPAVDHETYKTLVSFIAFRTTDPGESQRKCNAAWNPPADKINETGDFIRRLISKQDFRTRKPKIVALLNGIGWDVGKVFRKKRTVSVEGIPMRYATKLINESELASDLIDLAWRVGYAGNACFMWHVNGSGLQLGKYPPFYKGDKFNYMVTTVVTGKDGKDEEKVEKRNTGKLWGRLMLENKVTVYGKREFFPHGPDQESDCPTMMYNTWQGFEMMKHEPKQKHTTENDVVDVFLSEVYGEEQKEFLFKLWAYYIQRPGTRTGRMVVIRGEEGSGKTSIFHILEGILGRNLCMKTCSVDAYLHRFNVSFKAKKVIFLDDVYGVKQDTVRRIMPKVTTSEEEYEPKGLPRFTMNEVSEIYFSGNQDSPIHTTAKSRRDLIFETTNAWVGKAKKFNGLYEKLSDKDVMFAWFQKLRHLDIEGFNPRSANPETTIRNRINRQTMPLVLEFFNSFFAQNWLDTSLRVYGSNEEWVMKAQNYKHHYISDRKNLVVSFSLFLFWMKHWLKENHPNRKKLSKNNLLQQLDGIGVKVQRGLFKGDSREGLVIKYEAVKQLLETNYGIQCDPWWHEQNPDQYNKIKQKCLSWIDT